jgi:hypothetical protein
MRKFTILLITMLLTKYGMSQTCLPQGVTFSMQTQIDNFQTNYPNCTQIEGDVFIGNYYGGDITNLNGLSVLTSIGGNLHIQYNTGMTSLAGLHNLTSIGGYLYIESYWDIPNLTGLDNLSSIGGSLFINDCIGLTSLTGLDSLKSIGGYLTIRYCNALTSLSGLENINAGSISDLSIYSNNSLNTCAAKSICDYLASPNGTVQIYGNAPGCNTQQEVELACEVGIEEGTLFANHLNIYPNPSSISINISAATKGRLSLQNLNGQDLLIQESTQPTTAIDISTFPDGIYIMKLTGEKTIRVGKLVKQ